MGNRENERIKKKNRELRQGLECSECGTTENVEFAHIKPTSLRGKGRGRKERFYDIRNHPESYRPLCKHCHESFDHEEA